MACVGQWMAWHGMCGSVEGMAWRERERIVYGLSLLVFIL